MGRVLLMEPLLTAPRLRSLDMPKQGSAEWQAALAVGIPLGEFATRLASLNPDPIARAYADSETGSWIQRGLVMLEGPGYRLVLARLPKQDDADADASTLHLPDSLVVRQVADGWQVIDLVNPARTHRVTQALALALLDPTTLDPADVPLLLAAGLLTDAQTTMPADWEPHDAFMHGSSRLWLGPRRPYGALPELKAEALPVRPERSGPVVVLPEPGSLGDASLADVLRDRHTSRDWTGRFTLEDLSTFLHAIWFVRAEMVGTFGEEVRRALPSAGGLHPLQPWVVADNVDGLDRGIYWYDSWDHALVHMGEESMAVKGLLWSARSAAVQKQESPIGALIVLTARFGRLQRKYRSIAYSAILKDVGVTLQTGYLVGTAMGMNVCGLGGGNAALFQMATGLDPWVEGSVGEFIIGRPKDRQGEDHS